MLDLKRTDPQIDPTGPMPGVAFRSFRGQADYPAMLAVVAGSKEADGIERTDTLEAIARNYQYLTNCDPYRDMVFAEVGGQVVGYSRVWWWRGKEDKLLYSHFAFLLPEWREKGIRRAMLRHNERRLVEIAAGHPASAPKAFETWASDSETHWDSLLRQEGYEAIRYGFQMVRPDLENIPDLPLPEGLEVRPVDPEHYQTIWEAAREGFRDEWEYSEDEWTDEQFESFQQDPVFDPSLWQVAWDGDQVAGMVLNFINHEENEEYRRKRGYTEAICVRRPWRRQGLAKALIARSFGVHKALGMTEAALGVDSQNPNGALHLYESMGFRRVKRNATYRKPLIPTHSGEKERNMTVQQKTKDQIERSIQVPGAPDVPGLGFRGFRGEVDFPAMVSVIDGSKKEDEVEWATSVEDTARTYRHLVNSDPERDMLFAEVEGEVVGYSRVWWDQESKGTRLYGHFVHLLPEWRGKGIRQAMVRHSENRLREIAAGHPQDGPRFFEASASETNRHWISVLTGAGYEAMRWGFDMVRPGLEKIPDLPLPEGLEVRPVGPDQYRTVWQALNEAFQDHWGAVEWREEWLEEWMESPTFNPDLWQVAWAGDEVAGTVLNYIDEKENQEYDRKRGYTEFICVRRPWRRQGLAKALIARSLGVLKGQGMTEAALGVDTQNLHGALRLYESMGFRPVKQSAVYRKPLD